MARARRECIPGGIYHVISRGNGGEPIFRNDDDRQYFLQRLAATVDTFGWLCHAYCLMANHYHVVLETPLPNLATGMGRLNSRYAQAFNARYDRYGHLFASRYRSIPVESEEHFFEVCRYVVLNPVRALLCADPAVWPWSSYAATAGLKQPEPFLSVDRLLSEFGPVEAAAREDYRKVVAAAMSGA